MDVPTDMTFDEIEKLAQNRDTWRKLAPKQNAQPQTRKPRTTTITTRQQTKLKQATQATSDQVNTRQQFNPDYEHAVKNVKTTAQAAKRYRSKDAKAIFFYGDQRSKVRQQPAPKPKRKAKRNQLTDKERRIFALSHWQQHHGHDATPAAATATTPTPKTLSALQPNQMCTQRLWPTNPAIPHSTKTKSPHAALCPETKAKSTTTALANQPTTAAALNAVFDSSVSDDSLSTIDNSNHYDDLLSLDHDPANLFNFRRDKMPTLAQRLRRDSVAANEWRAMYIESFTTTTTDLSATDEATTDSTTANCYNTTNTPTSAYHPIHTPNITQKHSSYTSINLDVNCPGLADKPSDLHTPPPAIYSINTRVTYTPTLTLSPITPNADIQYTLTDISHINLTHMNVTQHTTYMNDTYHNNLNDT